MGEWNGMVAPQDSKPIFECEVGKIPKKAEEALRYKLKVAAQAACKAEIKAFAECCSDKIFSIVYACRPHLNSMNDCLKQYKTDEQLLHFKQQWVEAKCPGTNFN